MATSTLQTQRPKTPNKKNKNKQMNIKIETINEQEGKLAPIVGYFPSGYDPIQQAPPNNIKVYRNQVKPKRLQLVVSPSGSKLDFVGSNYSGEAAAGKMCSFALGVLDKDSHVLKIVPIAANKVFRLEPRVSKAKKSKVEEATPAEDKYARINDLTNLYGTSQARKRARKAELLRQTEDPTAQQGMDEVLQETAIDKEALTSTAADVSRNLPPHNVNATTPESAYPLDQIILKGEWDHLNDIIELLQDGKEISVDHYPSFVCNRVYKLEVIQDEAEKKRLAGILSYIGHLVRFKDQHTLDGGSSSKYQKIPSMLYQKFIAMFVDADKKRLSDEKLSLLVSYVLVLTLFMDEFNTDIVDIARDLKMSSMKVRPYYENLGCKLRSQKKVMFASLPVPLIFPTVRKRKRRG